ncbi:MAG TPA: PPC domain-containing protein [Microcoleaceae cyanobacterium]
MENCFNPAQGTNILPIADPLNAPLTTGLETFLPSSSSLELASAASVTITAEPDSMLPESPIIGTASQPDIVPADVPSNLPIVVTEPNNTFGTAYQISSLIVGNAPTVFSGTIDDADSLDYYQFTLSETSNFNVALTHLIADADIYLYNQDGRVALNGSFRGGTRDEAINQTLAAGTYYLGVRQSSGSTSYNLLVSTTLAGSIVAAGWPSNLLPTEFEVAASTTSYSRSSWIWSTPPIPTVRGNTTDVYRIHLDAARTVNISLTGLVADLDLRLIQDTNSNQIIDVTEQINQSQNSGWDAESISTTLEAGDYYLQVYSAFGSSSAYTLNIAYV